MPSAPFGRHWFLLSYSRRQIAVPYYSGLTKTSTALPRLSSKRTIL
ncbi:AzlC family protein [Neisseria meningitidis]|nr:AzlC family protein [Neisseria meningitidis]